MRKKLLTILVSIFVVMATFTVNVFADEPKNIKQLLNTYASDFPVAIDDTVPDNAWISSNNKCYISEDNLCFNSGSGYTSLPVTEDISRIVDTNNFECKYFNIIFNIENDKLISIERNYPEGSSSLNGTYTAPVTIADILPSDFPKAIDDTVPDNAWISSNNKCYISKNNNLCFERGSSSYSLGVGAKVSRIDTNSFKCISYNIIFNIENNKLISIEKNITDNPNDLNGIYTAPKGTQDNPWDIGATGNESNVKAWLTEVSPATDPKTYTLTIQGTGAMADLDTGDWPWNSNRSSITSVVISDGITNVGMNAFNNCSYLTSVIMPNTITSIGRSSFNECSSLTSIELSNSLTTIGMDAFQNSGLNSIVIPATVSSIESSAFAHCTYLSSVKVLNSTTPTIGDDLFKGCPNLHIYVPENAVSSYKDAWTTYEDKIEAIPVTIANVLANSANTFPTTSASGWVDKDGNRAYINETNLKIDTTTIPLNTVLSRDENNYYCQPSIDKYVFVIQSGVLTGIEWRPLGTPVLYSPYAYINPSRSITVGSTSDVEFETNAVYENDSDVTVKVDGNTLTLSTHYTQYQGSTHVILKSSYLSTLAAGTHTITIGVNGYSDINQDFTITAESTPSSDPTPRYKVPNTGVEGVTNNHSLLKLSSLSLLAVGTYLVIKKRKDNY